MDSKNTTSFRLYGNPHLDPPAFCGPCTLCYSKNTISEQLQMKLESQAALSRAVLSSPSHPSAHGLVILTRLFHGVPVVRF